MLNGHSAAASKGEISPSAKPRERKEGEGRRVNLITEDGEKISNRKKKSPSECLAEKLLLGWTMLGDTCPQCSEVPLMRDRENQLFCVACEAFLVPPLAASSDSSSSSSNSPPQSTGCTSTHPLVCPQYRLGASIPLDQADDNRLESTAEHLTRRTTVGEGEERISRRRVPAEERKDEEETNVDGRRMTERTREDKKDESEQLPHTRTRGGGEEATQDLNVRSGGDRHISSELIHWRERVLNQQANDSSPPPVSPSYSIPPLPSCSTSAAAPPSSSSSKPKNNNPSPSSSSSLRLIHGGKKNRGGEGDFVLSPPSSSSAVQNRFTILHAAETAVLSKIQRYTAMLMKKEFSPSSFHHEGEAEEKRRGRTRCLATEERQDEEEEERANEPLDAERDREILLSLQTAVQVLSSLDTLKRLPR